MTTQNKPLTADQIAWCVEKLPGFARSYADVLRRDADVAENRRMMTETRPAVTALSNPATPRLRLAERLQRDNREERA